MVIVTNWMGEGHPSQGHDTIENLSGCSQPLTNMPRLPKLDDEKLWQCALTHRSYANEHPQTSEHNERLEFLGDAVLGFLVGEFLYQRYPHLNEAQLTRLRSKLVDETQLSQLATALGIGELMRLGKGAIAEGGRSNPALLSDTLEAIVGAYFLEAGIEAVRTFIRSLFQDLADSLALAASATAADPLIDVKNRLQQWALSEFQQTPEYVLLEVSGPDHAREYTFEVRLAGHPYGTGRGRRKQDATKAAAADALKAIGLH